jgi:hypothetical protein
MTDQTRTDYEPTNAEQKILEVLLDPNNRFLPVTKICQLAEVSRATYYEAFKKPEFVALVKKTSREMVDRHLMPVMNAFVKEAIRGSYNHGKVILEMAGLYTERQEITGKDGGPIQLNNWVDMVVKAIEGEDDSSESPT